MLVKHVYLTLLAVLLCGCATVAQRPVVPPDFAEATAVAKYRPVDVPGTQRRVAQNEAEASARRQLLEQVGNMPAGRGTVNDAMARNTQLRAQLLDVVRNAELVDWRVTPECERVQVWMRVDRNHVRTILAACGS